MKNERDIPVVSGPVVRRPDDYPSVAANGTGAGTPARKSRSEAPNLFRMLHHSLRGRYALVISSGIVAAGLFAGAAWKFIRPIYASDGLVRIAFSMPVVRQSTDQNQGLPMFETFMASQKTLITSRRVIDAAIQDPVWRAMGRAVPLVPDQYFAEHLSVDVKSRSELIRITIEDPDPVTAAAAVTSIVTAYSELYTATEKQLERERIGLLSDQQSKDQTRIVELNQQLLDQAQEFGTTKLDMFFEAAAEHVRKLETASSDLQVAMLAGPKPPSTAPATQQDANSSAELTPEFIALSDPTMRLYLQQQEQRQEELATLQRSFPDSRPQVVAAKVNLDSAKQRVAQHLELYRKYHAATAQNLGDGSNSSVSTAGMTPEQIQEKIAQLQQALAPVKKEMIRLGMKRYTIEGETSELEALKSDSTDLAKRMESLQTEGALGGRLNIISAGEVPLSPSIDRRLKLAPAFGAFGLILPAGIAVLVSLVQRRYRYADETIKDTSLSNVPLLGMLPEVGRKADSEIMHATAHGIHQMRVLLCANTPREEKRSYLVTSATEGEGKTNLTVALGMSYAAAKRRTLVIDCDFVGRRLTQGFKAVGHEGLYEAMQEGRIGDRLRQESPLFYVLPAGKVTSSDACGITADAIRTILNQTREQFDTVLIDTGPILGSLEAAVLAQEVDGVILTISRGQHPALVEHALRRLSSVRARVVGAVFNRAKLGDFHGSAYTSSQASSPAPDNYSVERAQLSNNFNDFGPLVRAVSLGTPAAA